MGLEGRVAMVTGAARGIGRAIAGALGEEGAAVGVVDARLEPFTGQPYGRLPSRVSGDDEAVPTAEQLTAAGIRSIALQADVSEASAIESAVAEIERELGPVDVLVNNAGITTNFVSLARTEPDEWQREISVNLSGAFHCMRAAVPGMVERGWGRVINISSIAAYTPGLHPAYAASKAGLLGLTRSVAKEVAGAGVTVNAVLPGLTASPLVRALGPDEFAAASIPVQRVGLPEEVAAVVRFLASTDASYVTGVDIPCDGGAVLGPPPAAR